MFDSRTDSEESNDWEREYPTRKSAERVMYSFDNGTKSDVFAIITSSSAQVSQIVGSV